MPREDLSICVAVGRFDADDQRALVPLLDAIRTFPTHAAIYDTSRVEEVVPEAFVDLERVFRARYQDRLAVEKVAVVAPKSGVLRALAAGIFALLEPPFPVATFASLEESLAWVGRDARDQDLLALAEREAIALKEDAFDAVVAAWLAAHVGEIEVERCARDVGVSVRTLQRRLAERGTSFEHEANAARVRVAEARLETEAPLTEIAYAAGFSSPQRFASVFRKLKGETPSEARARMRVAPRSK